MSKKHVVICILGSLINCSGPNATKITGSTGKLLEQFKEPKSQDAQVNSPVGNSPSGENSGSLPNPGGTGSPSSSPSSNEPSGDSGEDTDGRSSDGSSAPPLPFIPPESFVWKRYRPFEETLMTALELPKNQLCNELGQFSCIDTVHLTLLGGNEPFINGQHERAERPTVLTSIAVERIVLAGCTQRLNMDKANQTQKIVFKQIDLTATQVTIDQTKGQAKELYQRFYGRDPTEGELNQVGEIIKMTTVPEKVALGLCFAIGSSIENVFL